MTEFSRLLDRQTYVPALWDLQKDPDAVVYWIEIFKLQFNDMLRILAEQRGDRARQRAVPARDAFFAWLEELGDSLLPAYSHVHAWTVERERLLKDHGISDPYRELKQQENEQALRPCEETVAELLEPGPLAERLRLAVAGVFAGNIFDLGSPAAFREHRLRGVRFRQLRDSLQGRPWLRDHGNGFVEMADGLVRDGGKAVVLVDNAGPDFLCGTLPLGILLAERGAKVVLAANKTPTLNDVTCAEAAELLDALAARLPVLAQLIEQERLSLLSTGTGTPGIDFRNVGAELDQSARDAGLLVLEGQGRALETNWHTRFDVDTVRIATIKDQMVADTLGGAVFDPILDVRPAGTHLVPTPK